MKLIYFDNAATTNVDTSVVDRMVPFFTESFGNPDSVHIAAQAPLIAIKCAEEKVGRLLHAGKNGKVIFTSGGTESNNMVFRLCNSNHPVAMNVISSRTEHKSVLEPAMLCNHSVLRWIKPGGKGYISADDLSPNEIPEFTLISLMYMNNETGMINEVYKIGEMLRKFSGNEVYFHVDCVQAAGTVDINVNDMNADLVSVSSHKLHGPKGVGCLWVSDRLLSRVENDTLPMIVGGGQQNGLRSGTMNVPGIVGFGEASEIADEIMADARNSIDTVSLRFADEVERLCDKNNVSYYFNFLHDENHNNKIQSVTFPGADSETVVMIASQNGLCVSNGAACNSESSEPSYVLTNSGYSPDEARNTIRVSFSRCNTLDEAIKGAEILVDAVKEVLKLDDTFGV